MGTENEHVAHVKSIYRVESLETGSLERSLYRKLMGF